MTPAEQRAELVRLIQRRATIANPRNHAEIQATVAEMTDHCVAGWLAHYAEQEHGQIHIVEHRVGCP